MINANELRLGNLVSDDFGRVGHIIQIRQKRVFVKLPFSTLNTTPEDVVSIPITAEGLLKLGFKRKPDGSHWTFPNDNMLLEVSNHRTNLGDDFHIVTQRHVEPRTAIAHFNYVHQLQNLYFALTGVDLQRKGEG